MTEGLDLNQPKLGLSGVYLSESSEEADQNTGIFFKTVIINRGPLTFDHRFLPRLQPPINVLS